MRTPSSNCTSGKAEGTFSEGESRCQRGEGDWASNG